MTSPSLKLEDLGTHAINVQDVDALRTPVAAPELPLPLASTSSPLLAVPGSSQNSGKGRGRSGSSASSIISAGTEGDTAPSNATTSLKRSPSISSKDGLFMLRPSSPSGGRHSDDELSDTAVASTTGIEIANSKRNSEFHALFRSVPEDDMLINDYGCALQKEILVQGRLYISENHVCFNANIFGWVTNLVIAFAEIISIEKKMTAMIIPNSIQISTMHARHLFSSLIFREQAYDQLVEIWQHSHPAAQLPVSADSASTTKEEFFSGDSDEKSHSEFSDNESVKEVDDVVSNTLEIASGVVSDIVGFLAGLSSSQLVLLAMLGMFFANSYIFVRLRDVTSLMKDLDLKKEGKSFHDHDRGEVSYRSWESLHEYEEEFWQILSERSSNTEEWLSPVTNKFKKSRKEVAASNDVDPLAKKHSLSKQGLDNHLHDLTRTMRVVEPKMHRMMGLMDSEYEQMLEREKPEANNGRS